MVNVSLYAVTWLMATLGNHMVSAIRCVQCNAGRATCHSGALLSQQCPPHASHCFVSRAWNHWGRSFVWRGCSARGQEAAGCKWVQPANHQRYMRCVEICDTSNCNSGLVPTSWRASEPQSDSSGESNSTSAEHSGRQRRRRRLAALHRHSRRLDKREAPLEHKSIFLSSLDTRRRRLPVEDIAV